MREEATTSTTAGGPGLGRRIGRAARGLAREAAAAFGRTPLEVLLGAATAIGFSTAVQWESMEAWAQLLVAVGIALPLTYAASALRARGLLNAGLRWGISAAALIAAASYGFFLFDPERTAEIWRAWLLVGAAIAALLCVPLVGTPAAERRERTHGFVARLAFRTAIVMAYAAALWVGLALALAALNALFELRLSGKAWQHLAAVLFMLLPPWAVAAGLPALVAPGEPWREDELRLLRRVGAYLLAPLVLVYLGIVYAYTVRVFVTGGVPKNLVSPVVIGAGLLIVATTVALEPAQRDEGAGGLAFLVRLFGPLLLPLVLFAIWAVSARVDQYGWTEFRFLRLLVLLLLAAFGAAAAYLLLRRRRPPLAWLPAVLAVVLLLAAVGPWSATAVAHRSQAAALRALLAQAARTGPGGAPAPVPPGAYRGITDKSAYLQRHFGWTALSDVVPWIGAAPADRIGPEQLAARIGVVERVGAGVRRVFAATLADEQPIPGVAGGTLFVFDTRPESGKKSPGRPDRPDRPAGAGPGAAPGTAIPPEPVTRVRLDTTPGRVLVLAPAGDTLVAELAPLLRALLARTAAQAGEPIYRQGPDTHGQPIETGRSLDVQLTPADVVFPVAGRDGRPAGQLVLRRIAFEATAAPSPTTGTPGATSGKESFRITSAGGFLLLPPGR